MDKQITQPATGLGSVAETNRLLGGNYFSPSGSQVQQFTPTPSTATPPTPPAPSPVPGLNLSTTTTQPPTAPATPTTPQDEISQAKTERQKILSDVDVRGKQVDDATQQIINGSFPLNPGEISQIQGLQQQYQQLIENQRKANISAEGIANIRGYQTGAAEYDPTFQQKTIGSIMSDGAAKIANLNVQMSRAVAQLTTSFQDKKLSMIKAAYDDYKSLALKRADEIQKTIDDAQKQIKDSQSYQLDLQKFQETKDQHAFDNAYKMEELALKRRQQGVAAGNINIPTVQTTINGTPDKSSQQAFLKTLPPATATGVQGLADYTIDPNTFSSRIPSGQTESQRQIMVTLAKQFDPTFDEKMYGVRSKFQKDLASNTAGSIGASINAANKAMNHLTSFIQSMSQLDSTPSSITNWYLLSTAGQINPNIREAMKAAQTEGLGVSDELAKFFKGTGTTDMKSVDEWRNQLSVYASPADVKGLTQGAINLMAGQLEVLNEQYTRTMGKPPEKMLLGQTAISNLQTLKNQGYSVNIPGVYYTDLNAYKQYGGGTDDALRSAYQTLKNLNDPNNPPTPENVLELAQRQ